MKKKEKELIAAEAEYRELATKNNVPVEAANKIWDIIKLMGLYSFKQKVKFNKWNSIIRALEEKFSKEKQGELLEG